MNVPEIIEALAHAAGEPAPPEVTDPFGMILLEVCAYLVSDEARLSVYKTLAGRVGKTPKAILRAPEPLLAEALGGGGMKLPMRAEKVREAARLAEGLDVALAAAKDAKKARAVLKKFPSIGDPGADKILLFAKKHPVMALESNGLRALVRLGVIENQKSYSATYKQAIAKLDAALPRTFDARIRAHQLLRAFGKDLCKATPRCEACPLSADCRAYKEQRF